jgi:hypothetical protein
VKAIHVMVLGVLLGGCDDPLKSVELVAEPRVLGARVEVEGDPGRAAPAPGEAATATFLVASPDTQTRLGYALAACPAAARQGGRSGCDGEAFARVRSDAEQASPPRLDFEVPAQLDSAGRVLVLGIICPDGSPSEDGERCDGADPGTPVTLELELARDGDVSSNPELEPASLRFDGESWSEEMRAEPDCAGLGYPEVPSGSSHVIEVALDEADRDPLPRASDLEPSRESLQLSHFATAGDLTRAFDTIAWDDQELLRQVTWKAPAEPGLVRFWLVLRDFRGGGAFAMRAVCVH